MPVAPPPLEKGKIDVGNRCPERWHDARAPGAGFIHRFGILRSERENNPGTNFICHWLSIWLDYIILLHRKKKSYQNSLIC